MLLAKKKGAPVASWSKRPGMPVNCSPASVSASPEKRSSKKLVPYYNQRGTTVEPWTTEGTNAVNWTKVSCRRFKDNAARLQLLALAYNPNFVRQLAMPRSAWKWYLTSLREKLIKIGAKVMAHAKYITFHLAELAVPRKLFAAILTRIERLRAA